MQQPLAYIHQDAKIADNVVIEPFVTIYGDVEIGEGTWIGAHAVIMDGARIGKNCRIFPNAVIAAIPQDLKFAGEKTIVQIGDNTTIRECATVNRGTVDKWKTVVGSNCLLMAYVHVAHDCVIGNGCILANAVQLAGHVTVEDFAIIGGTSAIHQFVKIGKHVMISGGSLVRKDVPPYTMAGREPLAYVGINAVGLRRRGFSDEQVGEIQEIYRRLYNKGLNFSQALENIENDFKPSMPRDEILNFIKKSDRGIMRGSGSSKKDDDE